MIVVYHSKDLDGYASGAICKRKYPDAKLIGYDYGQPFPWDEIPAGEPVIMVDVSLPMNEMVRLANQSLHLTWIDHHKSAIAAYDKYEFHLSLEPPATFIPVLQDGIAACEIAWKYMFPNEDMPLAVLLLGMYDTWRQDDVQITWNQQILPFQYGMRSYVSSAESFPMYLLDDHSDELPTINDIKHVGSTILKYQQQQFELAMHGAFECEFVGYKAIACNIRGAGSLAFESVLKPEHDLMVGFGYTGSKWSFSLRTDKAGMDCSEIAAKFGGGGHRGAAGFAVENLEDVIDLKLWKKKN